MITVESRETARERERKEEREGQGGGLSDSELIKFSPSLTQV